AAAFAALLRRLERTDFVPVLARPHRDAMAEPELPADVPVLEPTHPVEVDLLVALGMPAHLARVARGESAVAHLVHAQPPLLAEERLDDRVAAVAVADVLRVRLLFDQEPFLLQVLDHELASIDAAQAVVARARDVHASVGMHAVDELQLVAQS